MFNLKPAGTPINHTQPERNMWFVISLERSKMNEQAWSTWHNNATPTTFPSKTSAAMLDHIECFCKETFSAYSTFDMDLRRQKEHKRGNSLLSKKQKPHLHKTNRARKKIYPNRASYLIPRSWSIIGQYKIWQHRTCTFVHVVLNILVATLDIHNCEPILWSL